MWLSWQRACLAGTKSWAQCPALNKLGVVALTSKPSPCEAEAGEREVQGHSHIGQCALHETLSLKKLIKKNIETSQISPGLSQTTFLIKFLRLSRCPGLAQSECPNALLVKLQTTIPEGEDLTPPSCAAGRAALR